MKEKMDTSNLKNIVVLKDLPSNLVEEAIVVLKENQKIQKLEFVDQEKKTKPVEQLPKNCVQKDEKNLKNINQKENKNPKDYIIKEAQLLIADYISKIENKNRKESQSFKDLKKKCKKLKIMNSILGAGFAISTILCFLLEVFIFIYLSLIHHVVTTNLSKSIIHLFPIRKSIPSNPCTCIPLSVSMSLKASRSDFTQNFGLYD